MADDILNIGAINDVSAGASGVRDGDSLDTGKLRRKYNFGDRVSELNIAQDPFFRFVSKLAKKPTDDPSFKFTERRPSFHKRYAYLNDYSATAVANPADGINVACTPTEGNTYTLEFGGDYANSGNMTNIYGRTNAYEVGDDATQPLFFLPNQIIKTPAYSTDGAEGTADVYVLWRVNSVDTDSQSGFAVVNATCIKQPGEEITFQNYASLAADQNATAVAQTTLEVYRSYVVGTVHDTGTGFPQTWDDQPFSTAYGQTQIWKTAMAMNNTDRATSLKYESNEWARIWKEKLIEHKWDIETALLFGSQNTTYRTTEGAVNFVTQYGNVFSLDTSTKTQDDFLDDMSAFLDPRYNNANATLFFVNTATYNWLHKLSGYFSNNLEISPNFRADMALTGKKKVFGVDITTISTPYGDMNVVRNIHLDSTNIKILAVNMKHCAYRPLVGNGINRDTAVYVGVQTLENTGVDRRVDLIQTEAGMEWQMPEAHAYWC